MGGKKKSLAGRLAKMSDEERARYMQMKADQEEEARRRKEQLVTSFMKSKIKREDAFARLNRAKINQHWHQFMRMRKCEEMKDSCEHLKKWIERVLALKNRTVDNLMKELDESEFQYSMNLQAHLQHVDNFVECHRKHAEQIRREYETDLDLTLDEDFNERTIFVDKSKKEIEYLMTLVYGQEIGGRASIRERHDYYLKVNEAFVKECKREFQILRKNSQEASGSIWRNISTLLCDYVERTDKRRAQLADMKRLDAESAAEISQNQERIDLQEIQIEKLKDEYVTLKTTRDKVIKSLETATKAVNVQSLRVKKRLQNELTLDEKQLRLLIATSKHCIGDLEKILSTGEYILQLAQSCRRFETEKEKIMRFSGLPVEVAGISSTSSSEESDLTPKRDVEEVFMKVRMESIENRDGEVQEEVAKFGEQGVQTIKGTTKYKILIKHKYKVKIKKTVQVKVGERLRKELDMVSATSAICPKRRSKSVPEEINYSDDVLFKGGIIEENIESLSKLDPIWFLYNGIKLDYAELRQEKVRLIEENRLLKQTIKSVLENAVLRSKEASRPIKKIRFVSAPLKYAL